MKFRKKPIVVEAVQLRWDNWGEMCDFANVGRLENSQPEGSMDDDGVTMQLMIPTLEGLMVAVEGDWIVKGIQGELYSVKPDIFEATYGPVTDAERDYESEYWEAQSHINALEMENKELKDTVNAILVQNDG